MIIIPHTKKLFNGLQKYLQVTKRKSGWTNLGMIEATEVKFFSRKMILGKLIGPAKLVPEIFRRGNYSSTI